MRAQLEVANMQVSIAVPKKVTHYDSLNVHPGAAPAHPTIRRSARSFTCPAGTPAADISRAYKSLARQLHPDRNQSPGAKERFQVVQEVCFALLRSAPHPVEGGCVLGGC